MKLNLLFAEKSSDLIEVFEGMLLGVVTQYVRHHFLFLPFIIVIIIGFFVVDIQLVCPNAAYSVRIDEAEKETATANEK